MAKGEVVLDQFAGSGTTILAAEKVGRIAYAMEYEPRYVDAAIGRWQRLTKLEATLAGERRSFEEIADTRAKPSDRAQPYGSSLASGQSRPRSTANREAVIAPAREGTPDGQIGGDSENGHA